MGLFGKGVTLYHKTKLWSQPNGEHLKTTNRCDLELEICYGKGSLIVWCLMPFSTVFQEYHGAQCTNPCFLRVLLTSTPQNTLSKPMAAFPHNDCPNNRQ